MILGGVVYNRILAGGAAVFGEHSEFTGNLKLDAAAPGAAFFLSLSGTLLTLVGVWLSRRANSTPLVPVRAAWVSGKRNGASASVVTRTRGLGGRRRQSLSKCRSLLGTIPVVMAGSCAGAVLFLSKWSCPRFLPRQA